MATWVFLRHGQSVGNVRRLLVPPADSPLTPLGWSQADACVDRLRTLGVRSIRCSPLLRARQTAERLRTGLGRVELVVDPRLVERSFGRLDTWSRDALRASEWDGVRLAWRQAPPGGETLEEVGRRMLQVLAEPVASPTLLVGHAGAIRAAVGLIDGLDVSRIGRIRVPHCEPWVRELTAERGAELRAGEASAH